MIKFLLWLLLFILCWPIALIALLLYPFVWLGVFELFRAIVLLPSRVLGARPR